VRIRIIVIQLTEQVHRLLTPEAYSVRGRARGPPALPEAVESRKIGEARVVRPEKERVTNGRF
jgi:hypothetical protein